MSVASSLTFTHQAEVDNCVFYSVTDCQLRREMFNHRTVNIDLVPRTTATAFCCIAS